VHGESLRLVAPPAYLLVELVERPERIGFSVVMCSTSQPGSQLAAIVARAGERLVGTGCNEACQHGQIVQREGSKRREQGPAAWAQSGWHRGLGSAEQVALHVAPADGAPHLEVGLVLDALAHHLDAGVGGKRNGRQGGRERARSPCEAGEGLKKK